MVLAAPAVPHGAVLLAAMTLIGSGAAQGSLELDSAAFHGSTWSHPRPMVWTNVTDGSWRSSGLCGIDQRCQLRDIDAAAAFSFYAQRGNGRSRSDNARNEHAARDEHARFPGRPVGVKDINAWGVKLWISILICLLISMGIMAAFDMDPNAPIPIAPSAPAPIAQTTSSPNASAPSAPINSSPTRPNDDDYDYDSLIMIPLGHEAQFIAPIMSLPLAPPKGYERMGRLPPPPPPPPPPQLPPKANEFRRYSRISLCSRAVPAAADAADAGTQQPPPPRHARRGSSRSLQS